VDAPACLAQDGCDETLIMPRLKCNATSLQLSAAHPLLNNLCVVSQC